MNGATAGCVAPPRRVTALMVRLSSGSSIARDSRWLPCSAWVVGSTVQPSPRRTISTSTSGWCDSISTTSGAPISPSRASIAVRVRELAGNSNHGPQVAGGTPLGHAGWGVDGQFVTQQRNGVERSHPFGIDAHCDVQFAAVQSAEQFARGGDGEADVELGVGTTEPAHCIAAVVDGSDVDHAHPQPAHLTRPDRAQPSGRLVQVGQHPFGAFGHRRRVLVWHPAATVGGEQWHTETAFQLGDALRERRGGDAQRRRRLGPGAVTGDRHEVAQLGGRQVRSKVVHIVKYY